MTEFVSLLAGLAGLTAFTAVILLACLMVIADILRKG